MSWSCWPALRAGASFQRWDVAGGQRLQAINLLGGETAAAGDLTSDFTRAATRGQNGPVRLWRLSDGVNLATTTRVRRAGRAAGIFAGWAAAGGRLPG